MCNVLKVAFALTVNVDIDLQVQTQRDGDTNKYSRPSSYDRPDIRTTWVTTKILVLTYDQSLELRPECWSRPNVYPLVRL
jgi:hypothetical protein